MSNYYFSDPNKTTFKALKFNGQYFARGRGLFIHLQKYYPDTVAKVSEDSISKTEFTPENFSKATHALKSHFKGIRFEYEDLDKGLRDEIKALSSTGEGWWPERKQQNWSAESTLGEFITNYENPPEYVRRLGRGINIVNTDRFKFQSGIDFTREGMLKALDKYEKLSGNRARIIPLPVPMLKYYFLPSGAAALGSFNQVQVAEWRVWQLYSKARERYFINA